MWAHVGERVPCRRHDRLGVQQGDLGAGGRGLRPWRGHGGLRVGRVLRLHLEEGGGRSRLRLQLTKLRCSRFSSRRRCSCYHFCCCCFSGRVRSRRPCAWCCRWCCGLCMLAGIGRRSCITDCSKHRRVASLARVRLVGSRSHHWTDAFARPGTGVGGGRGRGARASCPVGTAGTGCHQSFIHNQLRRHPTIPCRRSLRLCCSMSTSPHHRSPAPARAPAQRNAPQTGPAYTSCCASSPTAALPSRCQQLPIQ